MTYRARQSGLTYTELLVAASILAIAMVPALDALQAGLLGSRVHEQKIESRFRLLQLFEETLAEPFSALVSAAETAGGPKAATTYSDAAGTAERRIVYIALYDAANGDGDGNVFTVPDPDLDGDKNPYTGYTGMLWVRGEIEGTVTGYESLTVP